MPEDAPGNPGAERDAPPVRQARIREVREMQAKLHRWAGEDSSRRFGGLFNPLAVRYEATIHVASISEWPRPLTS
jgi:hypothetical protein